MNLLIIILALAATLITPTAWADITIHVSPNGNAQTTLAELQQNPNTTVSLTQALTLLKDPSLRNPTSTLPPSQGEAWPVLSLSKEGGGGGEDATNKNAVIPAKAGTQPSNNNAVIPAQAGIQPSNKNAVITAQTGIQPFALNLLKGQPKGEGASTVGRDSSRQKNVGLKPDLQNPDTAAPKQTITLQLAPGTYRLTETLKLDSTSSGSAEHPVTLQGPKDGSAIITGGRAVNGFTPVTDPAVLARLPEAARPHILQTNLPEQGITDYGKQARHGWGAWNVPTAMEVTYRNQPMTLARWPNTGFTKIATTPDGEKGNTFTLQGANLAAWKDEPELLATGYWFYYWADESISIKAIDSVSQKLTLSEPAPYYGMKAGQPVFIQNAISELDQPGEWYLDKVHGLLYFWPPDSVHENEVEVSLLEKLLVIENASYISINYITFQSARGDAITVRGGHHISIANSIIRSIGNNAATISGKDNGLTEMLIEDIGGAGIILNGGDRQTLTPANLYVERSTIRRFARVMRTYRPGILLAGVGNRAVGNQISESPHNAILFHGNDHLISLNEIFDVCKETGDAGAIYTGRDWTERGTVISYNYLHDIAPNGALGSTKGIYLDDQASGTIVRGNLFEKINEAVFIGGGRDNLIEDNVFLNSSIPIHLDARGKKWKQAVIEKEKDTLQKQLEAVPFNKSPYKDRYPHLAILLEDEPSMPKYNIARRNLVIGNSVMAISKDAEAGISIEVLNVLRNTRQ